MDTSLTKVESFLPIPVINDEDFGAVVSLFDILPRLQLMTSKSEKCQGEDPFPVNHFAFIKDQDFADRGEELVAVCLAFRPMALDTGDDIVSSHDIQSELFKSIQERASEANSGCMYGPQFLLWLPATKEYCVLFFGSASGRRESKNMMAVLKTWTNGDIPIAVVHLGHTLIKTKKYSWENVTIKKSDDFDITLPNLEEALKVTEDFNNPPKATTEVISEGSRER